MAVRELLRPAGDLDVSRLPGERTDTSYTLPEGLGLSEWLEIGKTLQRAGEAVQWWIGDWWRYGERHYGQMAPRAAKEAIRDTTGYAYDTVRHAGRVADRFDHGRRRQNVPFTHHAEVSTLPAPYADEVLARAAVKKLSSREIRDQARVVRQAVAREEATDLPAPGVVPDGVRLEVADARALPFESESVHLVVTSPPYGVGIEEYVGGGDVQAEEWPGFVEAACREMLRVAVPSGRLALNVPLDTTRGGHRPSYSQAVQAAVRAGWRYETTIVWHDQHLGKSVARGSKDSSAAPAIVAPVETIVLFAKGAWRREPTAPSDLTRAEWLAWTNGVWEFRGETRPWEGFPVAFPEELPRRLVKLLSSPGEVVLDPFLGSGTTLLAALKLGRRAWGSDRAQAYVTSTLRRMAAWQEGR